MRMNRHPAPTLMGALLVAGCMLWAAVATADEVTSKGTVLHGKVTSFSSGGVVFEPEYGKGALLMKWVDIENMKTDSPFQVLHGEDQEAAAPVQGLSDGKLLVGPSAGATTAIDIATIDMAQPIGAGGLSFNDRMRNYWRYWDGSLDLGFNTAQATTDTTGLLLAFATQRSKAPTRFTLGAGYRYGTTKQKGESKDTTQDDLRGLVRGEYDVTKRVYTYASGDAQYDAIRELSIRGVPKAGLGYIVWQEQLDETKRNFLQVEAGPSWVYEKYFGGDHRDFWAAAFGALAAYQLPLGTWFDWRADYLPAVDDWANNYLLRTAAGLTVPVLDPISAKLSLIDEYISKPTADVDRNSLFVTAGLSVGW
jgi:hypothetical protein